MGRRSQTPESRRLARERIEILFDRAREFFPENPALSDRCVDLARRIAMRQRVRIPRELRRRFCRKCSAYLVPGSTARVRIRRGKMIMTCLRCSGHRRFRLGGRAGIRARAVERGSGTGRSSGDPGPAGVAKGSGTGGVTKGSGTGGSP